MISYLAVGIEVKLTGGCRMVFLGRKTGACFLLRVGWGVFVLFRGGGGGGEEGFGRAFGGREWAPLEGELDAFGGKVGFLWS